MEQVPLRKHGDFWLHDWASGQDWAIWEEVYFHDCYRLDAIKPYRLGEIIVDVGTAVGAFCVKAHHNIVITSHATVFTLAHEFMHVLLDSAHRASELTTALFRGGTTTTKAVGGAKRIGPYPDAFNAAVGNDDTTVIRDRAENLP